METVLVQGATGNIGVSAVTAALRSKRNVLAVARDQSSADKLVKYIGSSKGITFAEANVLSDSGVKGIVDRVREGKLPPFQHVFSCDHHHRTSTFPLKLTSRDTTAYMLEQKNPARTWMICTASQGDLATHPVPAMTQGALFPMTTAAAHENESTSVRSNEIYLEFRVEADELAVQHGVTKSSDFRNVYELILANSEVRISRFRSDIMRKVMQ